MNTKEELLTELTHNTFVMLKPSELGGVGIFAVRDIPEGCKEIFSRPDNNDQWISIPKKDVLDMPPYAQALIYNYCLYDDENYLVPSKGFKKMDLSYYLNHSGQPNIRSVSDGDFFESLRTIAAGEELLVDYGTLVNYNEEELRTDQA